MDDDQFTDENTSRGTFGKRKDLFGSIASKEPYEIDKDTNNEKGRSQFDTKKNKSVFDEYEQRGGVLEGYEDLNSSRSNYEEDHVLSQMQDAQLGRCHSQNI